MMSSSLPHGTTKERWRHGRHAASSCAQQLRHHPMLSGRAQGARSSKVDGGKECANTVDKKTL